MNIVIWDVSCQLNFGILLSRWWKVSVIFKRQIDTVWKQQKITSIFNQNVNKQIKN